MKNKLSFARFFSFLTIPTSILSISSCASNNINNNGNNNFTPYEVIDLLGRKVKIKKEVNNVLCIGASALRLYSYVGDLEKLCAIESFEVLENNKMPVRPYSYAYDEYFKTLKAINTGGPMGSPNAEAIISAKPDLIFSLYNNVENMDNLQNKLNIPIVCLSYGGSDPFSENVHKSLNLIGKIVGTESRATTISNYIKTIQNDLNNRTKNILEENKPSVYLGYNTYNGGKGAIGDTLVNYTCFKEVNAKNVLSNKDYGTNNPSLNIEEIISLNPEMFFIDVFNYGKLVTDFKDPSMKLNLMQIDAFKNKKVYIQMPFNQYYTNIDIAIADCYFVGKTIFPNAFEDINIIDKYNEILSTLLNKSLNYYDLTIKDTKFGYGPLDFDSII